MVEGGEGGGRRFIFQADYSASDTRRAPQPKCKSVMSRLCLPLRNSVVAFGHSFGETKDDHEKSLQKERAFKLRNKGQSSHFFPASLRSEISGRVWPLEE